jgi:hypothetical protein
MGATPLCQLDNTPNHKNVFTEGKGFELPRLGDMAGTRQGTLTEGEGSIRLTSSLR